MNLNHLNIFYAVAEQGSVSKGAERLHISQPAVSKQLAEFERALGAPLFDRLPRGIRLTEAGRLLQNYARRLFAVEAEAERSLRELRGLERGRLAIGASTSIGAYLLPSALTAFYRAYPGIEVHLEIDNTEKIQKLLEVGALDIGFTEGFIHSEALEASVFQEDELVFIAAPDYAQRLAEPLTLEQLCAEPFLMRERGSGTREVIEEALQQHGLALPRPIMTMGNTEAIKRVVAESIGIAIVSRLTIQSEVREGRLIVLEVPGFTLRRPLHQLKVRGTDGPAAVRAFLKQFLPEFP
jgi:DNA-binding transcriptional LysR family regulator